MFFKERFVSSVRWHFFSFRNSRRKVCISCAAFADKRAEVSTYQIRMSDTCVFVRTRYKAFLRELLES